MRPLRWFVSRFHDRVHTFILKLRGQRVNVHMDWPYLPNLTVLWLYLYSGFAASGGA
jgi:hypothetical protein